MTTITIENGTFLQKTTFKNLEEFQLYVAEKLQFSSLSGKHTTILDTRIQEAKENPENFVSLATLKNSITRK